MVYLSYFHDKRNEKISRFANFSLVFGNIKRSFVLASCKIVHFRRTWNRGFLLLKTSRPVSRKFHITPSKKKSKIVSERNYGTLRHGAVGQYTSESEEDGQWGCFAVRR
jgi:hypothetical protein